MPDYRVSTVLSIQKLTVKCAENRDIKRRNIRKQWTSKLPNNLEKVQMVNQQICSIFNLKLLIFSYKTLVTCSQPQSWRVCIRSWVEREVPPWYQSWGSRDVVGREGGCGLDVQRELIHYLHSHKFIWIGWLGEQQLSNWSMWKTLEFLRLCNLVSVGILFPLSLIWKF